MNLNFYLLEGTGGTTPANGTGGILLTVGYVLVFGGIIFFMWRSQKKKQKEEKKLRENLQIGDEIVTIGGIYGRVVSLKEDTLVIESVSDHSKITIARWAIQTNLTVHDDV